MASDLPLSRKRRIRNWFRGWGHRWRRRGLTLTSNRPPRILYLFNRLGGVGGLQRSTMAFVRHFREQGCSVDMIYGGVAEPGHHDPREIKGVTIAPAEEFDWKKTRTDYDIIYVQSSHLTLPKIKKRLRGSKTLRILNWQPYAASFVKENPYFFDLIHYESEEPAKAIPGFVCPPPFHADEETFPQPDEGPRPAPNYYLTVFNPYGQIKGYDQMKELLDGLDRPLVWCYDLRSFAVQPNAKEQLLQRAAAMAHPNLIQIEAPSRDRLRTLYRHCDGYICLSQYESFSWVLVDAIAHGRPIASRQVGILREVAGFVPLTDFKQLTFNQISGEFGQPNFLGCIRAALRGKQANTASHLRATGVAMTMP